MTISGYFVAFVFATLPIAVLSFGLVYWAIKKKHLKSGQSVKQLSKDIEKLPDENSVANNQPGSDLILNKWMGFGGGFYGVVALFTYIVVEWKELMEFFSDMNGIFSFNVGMIVNFFIESLMNFITAITWPVYWMGRLDGVQMWVWVVAAYLGYELGMRLARNYAPLHSD